MQELQLYIQGQRIDLFKDESISITQSIQNVKDIAKVFTAFTQSFSVPASKTNNKIFKHYYNFDIDNGYDARKKTTATIELNNIPFQTGKVKLEGVDLKNNKPNFYRITFFGDIVDLKDKLGGNKLSDLNLQAYNLEYNAYNIKQKLTTSHTSPADIIVPLITHSQRLYYDSGSHDEKGDGNLYYDTGHTQNLHGVKWNELKYAIRVNKIIEAIENDFDLQFSDDFFKNNQAFDFNNLFLWLNRKSGQVEDLSGSTEEYETLINGWTPVTVSGKDVEFTLTDTFLKSNVDFFGANYYGYLGIFNIELTTNDTDEYSVFLYRNGQVVFSKSNHTGDIKISADPNDDNTFAYAAGFYYVLVSARTQITFTNVIWNCRFYIQKYPDVIIDVNNGATGLFNTNSSFTFNVNRQIPDIGILEFLTGLFKLFNLTAYVVDGVIQVKPLNDFYSNPNKYDISEFVDVNSSKVDVALPFKEVNFKFKDTKTLLANKFGEINNRNWGEVRYNQGQDLAEKKYKIEVPFGHLLYERMKDPSNGDLKNIQWGYNVDDSQSPYLGSPLLFYPMAIPVYTDSPISFIDEVDDDNKAVSHIKIENTIVNMPSNTLISSASANPFQLNFNREVNEWTLNTEFYETLFTKYYRDYILSVFNSKNRITKLTAYLPLRILLNLKLGDRLIINGNSYKINTITTNLQTGKSDLELLNDL